MSFLRICVGVYVMKKERCTEGYQPVNGEPVSVNASIVTSHPEKEGE